jgi:hypothetical protein
MTVYVTITRTDSVLGDVANGANSVDIAGQMASTSTTPLTNLQAANLAAQTAAWGAGTASTLGSLENNPLLWRWTFVSCGGAVFQPKRNPCASENFIRVISWK